MTRITTCTSSIPAVPFLPCDLTFLTLRPSWLDTINHPLRLLGSHDPRLGVTSLCNVRRWGHKSPATLCIMIGEALPRQPSAHQPAAGCPLSLPPFRPRPPPPPRPPGSEQRRRCAPCVPAPAVTPPPPPARIKTQRREEKGTLLPTANESWPLKASKSKERVD